MVVRNVWVDKRAATPNMDGGKMKLFYFWRCSIFILIFFFAKEGVCQSPYYQGKTITFVQGRDPGGVGDLRNKVMFQFMQKYIPGHPTIVSEYMPGGGGRKAANHLYHSVKSDGLTIGASSPGILASAVLGMTGVNFDPAKFIYLGSPFSENNNIFVTRKALGINSLEKLRERAGLRVGGQSVAHVQFIRGSSPGFWISENRDSSLAMRALNWM